MAVLNRVYLRRMEEIIAGFLMSQPNGVYKIELLDVFFPNKTRQDELDLDRILMRLVKRKNNNEFNGFVALFDGKLFWRQRRVEERI